MKFLEKDLEDIIWESDNKKLIKKGLFIEGVKKRQLRIGNYGIADLVTIKKEYRLDEYDCKLYPVLNITVWELKKEKIGISAFLQAVRYCKGIQTYLLSHRENIQFKLNIGLVAKDVDFNSDFIFLTDLIDVSNPDLLFKVNRLNAYSFKFDIDGIKFENHKGYNLTNKGF